MCGYSQESIYSAINLVWVLLNCSEGKFRDDNISVTLENLEKSLKPAKSGPFSVNSSTIELTLSCLCYAKCVDPIQKQHIQ